MFSFRELVESMEKKTSENIAPISCPTRLPLSCSFHDALIDCEERTREQTSEHTAETSNEQTDGLGRHEGFFECSESQKELEHREATFWEEKVVHPSREEQTECTEKVDTEALWKVKKETNLRLIFKHGNVTMKPENYSVNDLFDIVKRNDFTLPLLNPVYIDASTTSLQSEHHITLDSKGKLKPNTGEELPTPASRRLNEDTNIQVDKSNQLKTNRKTIGRIPTIHKIRDHVCRSVKQKHSHNISEKEISIDEEVSISSIVVRKQESENKVENCIPRDLLSHERQCAEICHHETSVKETLISNDKPERLKAAAQGSWSSDLHYHTTDCWKNTTTATTPLLNNNQNGYSEHHRNTSSKRLPINEEYEWAALRLQEYEEVKTVENFKSASKHDAKDSDRIKEASRASQLVFHDPKSGTPENIAKNITTHFAQNSREKLSNLRNKKDSKEINIELVKDLQNHNMHERKRNRRRDPQSLAPAGYSKGDNDGPRASSPLPVGFRCQLCSSWWRDETSLAKHQRLHAPGRPFACPDCPSRFNQLVHLQIHRRTHTGDKPFRCGTCSASFSRKDRLRSHERKHSGEQPYTCPYCPASFRDAGSLRGHVLTHAHQPPYTCRLCSATFAHLSTFTSHWRLHK